MINGYKKEIQVGLVGQDGLKAQISDLNHEIISLHEALGKKDEEIKALNFDKKTSLLQKEQFDKQMIVITNQNWEND